ncbi:hypothetical protein [Candidatus Epulonipiscium viviparus]|uniref:hypothetical protein n=1 Tax=Candidatus Epulonipiscium viviparus TaxID=420336 RepID=UPI0027380418|nr:hypothetical protein [Candidatus Epulopiscium viviparus]
MSLSISHILICCAIVYVLYKEYPEKFEAIKNLFTDTIAGKETYLLIGVVICFLYLQNELDLKLL